MSDLKEVLTENSYLRQKQLIFADCDRYQRARVSTLLSIAAAVAGADYDARGLTYDKLYEMREVFLLSRAALRIHRDPRALQTVDVTTWEDGVKGAHMQRVYEIADSEGVMVSIRSDWILVDPETWRILRPASFKAKPLTVCPKPIDCPEPVKIQLPREGLEDLGQRPVRWSDLDGNGHIYSGKYGDIVWDCLPAEFQDRTPREFFIQYSREATLGQTLQLTGCRDGNDYRVEGAGPGGSCFTALCRF